MTVPPPRVSVLMPVRDAGVFLEAALRSLARQTFADFEAVVVDDGSTDGSGSILERWSENDSRLRAIHTSPRGLVAALNLGLEACRADLVARMDADDACQPRRLQAQADLLDARPEVGVASCLVRHVPVHRVGEGSRLYERWLNSLVDHDDIARERYVESPVAHPSVMVRRELLLRVGGWRDLGWPEDHDLWLRLLAAGVRFAKVPETLYWWREHPDRLTRTDPRYSTDAFLRCKAHHLARGPLVGRRAVVWGAGRTGRRLARALLAEGAMIVGFVDIDPAKFGRRLAAGPVIAPDALPELLAADVVVLAAVASRGARELIRERLAGMGLVEGQGFWCAA